MTGTLFMNSRIDDVLKLYKPGLENVWTKYSVKRSKPGQRKGMGLEEWIIICRCVQISEEELPEKDMVLPYNLAMMT